MPTFSASNLFLGSDRVGSSTVYNTLAKMKVLHFQTCTKITYRTRHAGRYGSIRLNSRSRTNRRRRIGFLVRRRRGIHFLRHPIDSQQNLQKDSQLLRSTRGLGFCGRFVWKAISYSPETATSATRDDRTMDLDKETLLQVLQHMVSRHKSLKATTRSI
jgi:hypothetical protein